MNNTNPNENLEQNNNGVTPNVPASNNEVIEELGNTSSLDNVVGEINGSNNTNGVNEPNADRIDLFSNGENKDTAVIMSRQMADK